MKKKILIVGFGNEFCGDDVLGPLVVKLLQEELKAPNTAVIARSKATKQSLKARTAQKTRLLRCARNDKKDFQVDLQTARYLDFTWAEVMARYSHLIFVDASAHRGYPLVKVKKLSPASSGVNPAGRPFTSHHISIDHLLKITRELYGQKPCAYLVAIRGENFDFGEKLSPRGRQAANQAVKKILSLIKDLAPAI